MFPEMSRVQKWPIQPQIHQDVVKSEIESDCTERLKQKRLKICGPCGKLVPFPRNAIEEGRKQRFDCTIFNYLVQLVP